MNSENFEAKTNTVEPRLYDLIGRPRADNRKVG